METTGTQLFALCMIWIVAVIFLAGVGIICTTIKEYIWNKFFPSDKEE